MTTEMNINVEAKDGQLVIREGEALPLHYPAPIALSGTLGAPHQFLKGRTRVDETESHLLIKKDKGSIELVIGDRSATSVISVVGTLTPDGDLKKFNINTEKRWTIAEFLKFIKTMRFYFADKAAHAALVLSLQTWSVKIERVINEHNDNKGNSNFQLQTKVQQSAADSLISRFNLLIPIFQGYPKIQFTVEIGLDPKNTAVDLYLISDELIELEIGQREKLIEEEIEKFSKFACSKVVIS
jgi:hypothetical protein